MFLIEGHKSLDAVPSVVPSSMDLLVVEKRTGINNSPQFPAERTRRKDPLHGFNEYTNGWNISDHHYWASAAYTAVPVFSIARHPNRPTFLDHMYNMTEKFVELHGDREGYDDPAIVAGLGSIDGKTYMFIGHQKGRDTKENIQRNFAMPTPHGYRKALRLMEYADHHGFPIVTFIDTPGAFADLKSEQLGQGEAIAHNLRSMFALKVPVISLVIGEGGSGGTLAIGCANKLLVLENSVFFVASPEACGAILWKSNKAAPKAAERLKITASALLNLEIADGIIAEPLAGAHTDPSWMSQQTKIAINEAMDEFTKLTNHNLQKKI
ncbi:hypothetical protein KIW84_076345 [Lathyrus oleraceus]|uniref:acetyl-CoA carboxytransferase n=2 Tax=Pisum sativum TaxID=3888 RepID=A0A9D4VZ69_PEA|nr:hypothetical protein KIW84_076345 [Pisum sativum]